MMVEYGGGSTCDCLPVGFSSPTAVKVSAIRSTKCFSMSNLRSGPTSWFRTAAAAQKSPSMARGFRSHGHPYSGTRGSERSPQSASKSPSCSKTEEEIYLVNESAASCSIHRLVKRSTCSLGRFTTQSHVSVIHQITLLFVGKPGGGSTLGICVSPFTPLQGTGRVCCVCFCWWAPNLLHVG